MGAVDGGAARAEASRRRERLLTLVPIGVALALGLLLLPRQAIPDSIPLPIPERGGLAREAQEDRALAERARVQPLPGPVRALGTAIRSFHALEAQQADARQLGGARRAVDEALVEMNGVGDATLLELRAAQLEGFLSEMRRFEATGEQSSELAELGGGFVRTMTEEGWCEGHRLLPGEGARRAMFKIMWNAFVGLDKRAPFQPAINQERALYALYLQHPALSAQVRARIAAARRGAVDAAACARVAEGERIAIESWRIERIARLAAIDSTYPAAYARGVVDYRRGNYAGSAADFRDWLAEHPDGPLTLRAQSYLRAAVAATPRD